VSNLSAFSMWDLFRGEVESQMRVLTGGLLTLESGGSAKEQLAAAMRAAHSIKGAARIVRLDVAVTLSHAMEDCLVAAQEGALALSPGAIDILLNAGDLLAGISKLEESGVPGWLEEHQAEVDRLLSQLADVRAGKIVASELAAEPLPAAPPEPALAARSESEGTSSSAAIQPAKDPAPSGGAGAALDRSIAVSAETLNRLMGFAGESLVQSRWLEPFSESLLDLKRRHTEIHGLLELLQPLVGNSPAAAATLEGVQRKLQETRLWAMERQTELSRFGLRAEGLSDRLYREVVASRMRPFGDGVGGLPRMVRDVARRLGKQAQLEIVGSETKVDREILDRLQGPINHAIRNSLDHGIEHPDERVAAGKPPSGTIRLEARHRAGIFVLTVSDDGRGVDTEALRAALIDKGLAPAEMASKFSEAELFEFLFLPGFSTAKAVTDISGRGVGLDAVQEMAKSVGGSVSLTSRPGYGVTIHIQLPLTLSVLRMLVVDIGGEPFAFPMTRIANIVQVNRTDLSTLEGQQYFSLNGERIGVVSALEVLDIPGNPNWAERVAVVLLGDHATRYGLAVDRFVGEYEMVVRPLDARLGKVPSLSAAALMDDGSPVLVVDVEDLTRSVETLLHGGRLRGLGDRHAKQASLKRILVVDDSVTVREVQRSLLQNRGYVVEVAVDGMDGWNAVRAASYNLTITDVDMPRMNGIELVSKVRTDPKLNTMPVIIVSYKDREEDRMRGLDAGADRYLTKSSFHDETLLAAVEELIGLPE